MLYNIQIGYAYAIEEQMFVKISHDNDIHKILNRKQKGLIYL